MAAKATPVGSVPEKKDVKTEKSSPSEENTELKSAPPATDAPKEPEVEEEDLKTLSEEKKIPYERFKGVIDQKKQLQEQLTTVEKRYQEDLRRAVEEAELRTAARLKSEIEADPLEEVDPTAREARILKEELRSVKDELKSLRTKTSEVELKSQMKELQKQFPEADEMAALGWIKNNPSMSLDDAMELSHNRNIERAERKLEALIQAKKERQKAAIPTRESGIKLKDSERPKTVQAANQLLKRLFGT